MFGLGPEFVPTWLVVVSWIALAIAFACAAWILYDIFGRGYRQHMWIMEAVWPITALYFGPVAVWAYYRWGRPRLGVHPARPVHHDAES